MYPKNPSTLYSAQRFFLDFYADYFDTKIKAPFFPIPFFPGSAENFPVGSGWTGDPGVHPWPEVSSWKMMNTDSIFHYNFLFDFQT